MNKHITKIFICTVLILIFAINSAWCDGYVHKHTIYIKPSNLIPNSPWTFSLRIGCYDISDGRRLRSCPYYLKTIGLKEPYIGDCEECIQNNGGHVHNYDTHPLPPPEAAMGNTEYSIVTITSQMPEVSGNILREFRMYTSPGYYCVSRCFTKHQWRYETTLDIGVRELEELDDPGNDDHYVKLRGDTVFHPKGHYGTEDTIETLKEIVEEYYNITGGYMLSINDISLPKGGVFDFNETWGPPHKTHRTGTDVDINRAPAGEPPINCYDDKDLKEAVEAVSGGLIRPYLLCEDNNANPVGPDDPEGYFKHIDFD